MLILVSGGSASGKSEYAESLAVSSPARPLVYVATMEIWDEECRRRVARHRQLRAGKGFETVEAPRQLEKASVPEGASVLLECLSNLTANEYFGPQGPQGAYERILSAILDLERRCAQVTVVTNEVFSDGISYPAETADYCALLARLNCALAQQAAEVWEVCCSIPLRLK